MAKRFLSDIHATAGLKDSSGDLGSDGQVLSSTGAGTNWVQAGSGATVIYDDQFIATANQTVFTLSNTVDAENKTQVYIDGAYQAKAGYTVSGTTLTFDTGLDVSSKVEVITFATAIASNATAVIKLDEFVPGDAISNTSGQHFTLSQTVSDEKVTQVYINGVYQHKDTYSISGTTLQFSSAPPSGSDIEVITFDTVVAADGTLSATTFLGDLNGTINTATTATTQSAGNNSTKISTTAYTDAKVADAINNGTTAIAPSQNAVFDALALKSNIAGPTFTGTPAAPTASAGTNTTQLATTAFVTTGISNIVDSSPAALNTLNELAAALGDDANFSTTVTNSIATKLPLAGGTLTGALVGTSATFSGNVGIGTTSPSSKLHIRTSTNFNYEFEEVSSKLRLSALNDARSANVPLQFAASEFNFITGNVTIGTAAPQDFYLALRGGVGGFFGWDDSANKTIVQAPNTRSLSFQVNSDTFGSGTEALTISSGGAATFNSSLAGFGATITNNNDSSQGLLVRTSDNDGDEYILDLQSSSSATGTNYSSKFKVAKGGKVGIGTDSPDYQLDIENSSHAILRLHAGANSSASLRLKNDAIDWDVNCQTNDTFAIYSHTSNTQPFSILPNGSVGIGTTSPSDKLHVENGNIRLKSNSDGSTGILKLYDASGSESGQVYPSGGDLRIYSPNDVIFNNGGKVGIGNTNPSSKLHVSGTIKADASGAADNPLIVVSDNGGGLVTFYRSSAYTQMYMSSTTSGNQFYVRSQGSGGVVLATGGTSWGNGSDARLKKNFETTQGLSEVLQIEPIKYHLKTQDNSETKKLGFKAQNLQTVIPEMILDMDEEDPEDGSKYLGIIPDYLFPVLVKAIQEQQTIIEDLKSRIETLEG